MTKPGPNLYRLLKDREGAAVIEFAVVAPALITMLIGVLMIGIYMKDYNSVRAIAYDTNRYTVVEYQKSNKMTETQIAQVATAIARRSPYNLAADEIETSAVEEESGISGAKKFTLTVAYTPPEISGLLGISPPRIEQTETIIVPE